MNKTAYDTQLLQASALKYLYLEYQNKDGQTIPVLPTGSPDAKTDHYFRVIDTKGDDGVVYIVINGNRFTINGQPIKITE